MKNITTFNIKSKKPILISCEHASGVIPKNIKLGLKMEELIKLSHHYDIGAKEISKIVTKSLNAKCLFTNYSRLVIDVNRNIKDPTLIRKESFSSVIPGNINLGKKELKNRIKNYYKPYHAYLHKEINILKKQNKSYFISIHSFNHKIMDVERKFDIGILFKFKKDEKFCRDLKKELEKNNLNVNFNEPYSAKKNAAFCMRQYGTYSNIRAVEIEINDKHLKSKGSIEKMGNIISSALNENLDL